MQTWRAFAFFLLAATAILLAGLLMPRGAAEDLPPLDVLMPREHDITNNSTLVVTGITVPNATVQVWVESRVANRSFDGSAKEDGTFSVVVELSDVIQHVIVTVTDAQNRSSTVVREVVYDNEPPSFIVENPPTSPWYTNKPYIAVRVLNTGSPNVKIWINGVDIAGSDHLDIVLTEGENRIQVRAEDPVGNEAVEWVVVILDRTPPVLGLDVPVGDRIYPRMPMVNMSGSVYGATRVFLKIDDAAHDAKLTSGDWDTGGRWWCSVDLGPDDGMWSAVLRATDAVGNVAEQAFDVVLDRRTPTLVVEVANRTNVPRVEITGQTDEDVQVMRINGFDFPVNEEGRFDVIWPLSVGINPIVLGLTDSAGNIASTQRSVFYNFRGPTLRVERPEVMDGKRVRIAGRTEPFIERVTIGRETFPVVNGSFSAVVNVTWGRNEFIVMVKDPAGSTGSENIVIFYPNVTTGLSILFLCALVVVLIIYALKHRRRKGGPNEPKGGNGARIGADGR